MALFVCELLASRPELFSILLRASVVIQVLCGPQARLGQLAALESPEQISRFQIISRCDEPAWRRL